MSEDYRDYFERREREKREKKLQEEAERKRREEEARKQEEIRQREEERRRREAERKEEEERRRRIANMTPIANRFDTTIKRILKGYGDAKMKALFARKSVEGPTFGHSSVSWALLCRGYEGVEITIRFKENSRGELEPDKFLISGTTSWPKEVPLSREALLEALADSQPEEYRPPSSSDSTYSCSPCNMGIC